MFRRRVGLLEGFEGGVFLGGFEGVFLRGSDVLVCFWWLKGRCSGFEGVAIGFWEMREGFTRGF